MLPDERIAILWQYWRPRAVIKAAQLAPNDPELKQAIVEELRSRHHTQVVLLRREGLPWEYLAYRHGFYVEYDNPFLMDDERAEMIKRAIRLRLRRERKELESYVAQQLGSRSQQGPVGD
jgi:hypothetical protein